MTSDAIPPGNVQWNRDAESDTVTAGPSSLPWVGQPLPFLTAELPGIGGRIKVEPDDFVVDEVPAYEPSGTGEHLFLWIEKRDVAAEELVRHLSRVLRCPAQDIGVAGLKDRRAITRQYVSVPARLVSLPKDGPIELTTGPSQPDVDAETFTKSDPQEEVRLDDRPVITTLNSDRIRVLRACRHGNKLRTGHLKGNRFQIVVRDVSEEALSRANAIAERIRGLGFPNYYGEQRFGRDGETLTLGHGLLTGSRTPRDIPAGRRRFLLRLSLSAVQSHLFNVALAERLSEGLLHTVLPGDVMEVVASGGKFVVADVPTEQSRCNAHEIVVTGPMFGPSMKSPTDETALREARMLARSGLQPAHFSKFPDLTQGTRRPFIIVPGDLTVAAVAEGLRFDFVLPPGTYATTLLREFQKQTESDSPNSGPTAADDEELSERYAG